MRARRALVLLTAAAAAVSLAVAGPADASPSTTIGARGAGDPYFPRQGNGGYDVSHYGLDFTYRDTQELTGVARIDARATQTLSRFDLDLMSTFHVPSVTVNGVPARIAQPAALVQELVVTPAQPIADGAPFVVEVHYDGVPQDRSDPDGSPDGFIHTDDGVFVASEPQGSPTWFPVNDTPTDKATYDITGTVPKGLTMVSNGDLVDHREAADGSTWSWRMSQPISSYLVTATIGKFNVRTGTTAAGVPYFIAVDPREQAAAAPALRKLPAIVDFFSRKYGAYPFGSAGAIVDHAPFVGYALETATRPVFDRAPSVLTLAHELAHQWYGDGVTLAKWRDIWLNEGFAEFSSWLWDEHSGGRTTAQHLDDLLAIPASDTGEWSPPPGDPGSAQEIFAGSVYDRGAGTLAALREKLGDVTFFRIMRGWFAAHEYGNAHVVDFTAFAQSVAGQNLKPFFREWLYADGKPGS